jgi:hypothetical protein
MSWRGARPDRKQELALEQPIEALLAELETQPRALMRTGGIARRALAKRLIGAERPATGTRSSCTICQQGESEARDTNVSCHSTKSHCIVSSYVDRFTPYLKARAEV